MFEKLFPSAVLVAFASWPLLVSWLLWAAGKASSEHTQPDHISVPSFPSGEAKRPAIQPKRLLTYSFAGAVLGVVGVGCSLNRIEPVCAVFLLTGTFFPLLFFSIGYDSAGESTLEVDVRQERMRGERADQYPVLMVTFCLLMASCLRSAWAVMFFMMISSVLLGWWDGSRVRRAFIAWQMVRARLCGGILASIGLALLGEWSHLQGEAAIMMVHYIGSIFLVAGLGLIACLGRAVIVPPALGFFDTGLRFAALALMARLPVFPFIQNIMIVAAFIGLVFVSVSPSCHKGNRFVPSFLTGLGGYAAAYGQMTALIWLYLASVLADIAIFSWQEERDAPEELFSSDWKKLGIARLQKGLSVLAGMVIMILGQSASGIDIAGILLCFVVGFFLEGKNKARAGTDSLSVGSLTSGLAEDSRFWPDHVSGFDIRKDKAAWGRLALLCLFLLTFSGLFALSWHPAFLWSL